MAPAVKSRLDRDRFYMSLAYAVAQRADCLRQVGAVIVQGDRVVSTGYTETPDGMLDCTDGGCYRCRETSGERYDLCLCVHAEESALLEAARSGIALEGASIYTTRQPCFPCLRSLLRAGIAKVFYAEAWSVLSFESEGLLDEYRTLIYQIPGGVREISDTEAIEEMIPPPAAPSVRSRPAAPSTEARPKANGTRGGSRKR